MSKYDVIHKTGSTSRITTPPEEDRVTAMSIMQKKIDEDRTCSSEDMISDRKTHTHTDTHAHHNTSLPYRDGVMIQDVNAAFSPAQSMSNFCSTATQLQYTAEV